MICKLYGGLTVTGKDGKRVVYVWDHAADEPVTLEEWNRRKADAKHREAERRKWQKMRDEVAMEENKQMEMGL